MSQDAQFQYFVSSASAVRPEEGLTLSERVTFFPKQPDTLEELGLSEGFIEDLILKKMMALGTQTGRQLSQVMGVPFKILLPILENLKKQILLEHLSTDALGDFKYCITEAGKETALLAKKISAYDGTLPVGFDDYVQSVLSQSIRNEEPHEAELKQAFSDIVIGDELLEVIGPAVHSGRGIFIYGAAGNGKSTVSERIRDCFGQAIYIPRAIFVEGQIIQLFDNQLHEEVEATANQKYDARWVRIKRPAVMVGGELTMDSLEIRFNERQNVSEAPLHMKANGGIFLIDDFGRQRVDHRELLNRWIVPLEKRVDFLMLSNGRKIEIPFEQLIIFSTNLDPSQLVDEAFLRRIPYKINVENPDEARFKKMFEQRCQMKQVQYDLSMVDYLIETHYKPTNGLAHQTGMRACHPRDIVDQVVNRARYLNITPELTKESIDSACQNYFVMMNQ
jgi:predicted ATPase with chaperone activity